MDDGNKEAIVSPAEIERLTARGRTVTRATFASALLLTVGFVVLV
ncbi:MAG: hypothetical protein RIF41_11120 [Polyangiaceae bacterium]